MKMAEYNSSSGHSMDTGYASLTMRAEKVSLNVVAHNQ